MEAILTGLSLLFVGVGVSFVALGAVATWATSHRAELHGLITITSKQMGALVLLVGLALLSFSLVVLHMLT